MRFKIGFTPNLTLGPNGSKSLGVEGTYYIYDTRRECERMCYATSERYATEIRSTLEFMYRYHLKVGGQRK